MAGQKVYVHMLLCDEAVLVEGKKGGGSVQEIEFRLLSFDQYEDLRKTLFESKDINGALKKIPSCEGTRQGNQFATPLFCLSIHDIVIDLSFFEREYSQAGCTRMVL